MPPTPPQQTECRTKIAIMEATYAALCKHGLPNLTMQAIADEFDRSKAAIHYHYDTKEDLLVAFLEYLLTEFIETLDVDPEDDPRTQLETFLDTMLFGSPSPTPEEAEEHWRFHRAFLGVRTQAAYHDEFRAQLTRNYEYVCDLTMDLLEAGIDAGVFHDVERKQTAEFLLVTINGTRIHHVTYDSPDTAGNVHAALQTYLETHLYREDATQ